MVLPGSSSLALKSFVLEHMLNYLHHAAVDRAFAERGTSVSLHVFNLVFKPSKDKEAAAPSPSSLMEDHFVCIPYIPALPELAQVSRLHRKCTM